MLLTPPLHKSHTYQTQKSLRTAPQTLHNSSHLHLHLHFMHVSEINVDPPIVSSLPRLRLLFLFAICGTGTRPREFALWPRSRTPYFQILPSIQPRPSVKSGVAQPLSPTSYPTSHSIGMRLDLDSCWGCLASFYVRVAGSLHRAPELWSCATFSLRTPACCTVYQLGVRSASLP
ncbi:hypothetical protein BDW60DRAFT_181817 [Aspergillus nidulans var. acristatus]